MYKVTALGGYTQVFKVCEAVAAKVSRTCTCGAICLSLCKVLHLQDDILGSLLIHCIICTALGSAAYRLLGKDVNVTWSHNASDFSCHKYMQVYPIYTSINVFAYMTYIPSLVAYFVSGTGSAIKFEVDAVDCFGTCMQKCWICMPI